MILVKKVENISIKVICWEYETVISALMLLRFAVIAISLLILKLFKVL